MAAYFNREDVVDGWKALELPDIANGLLAGKVHSKTLVKLFEGDHYFCWFISEVEEADRDCSIPEFAGPDLLRCGGAGVGIVCWRSWRNPFALAAEWILVDVEHLVVRQKRRGEFIEFSEVAPEDQRRGEDGPEAYVSQLFILGEFGIMLRFIGPTDLANNQHVSVVPMAGTGEGFVAILRESNAGHVGPVVADIARGAPNICIDAIFGPPLPHVSHSVLAHGENHVAVELIEGGTD